MDGTTVLFVVSLVGVYSAVPPDVCFEQFRWEDCGQPPKAVMYYYKSGSRCEVGTWRGCQPNLNMFADEYECVRTCIFSPRAKALDFHSHMGGNELDSGETTTPVYDDDAETTTEAGSAGTDDTGETGATSPSEHGEASGDGATDAAAAEPTPQSPE